MKLVYICFCIQTLHFFTLLSLYVLWLTGTSDNLLLSQIGIHFLITGKTIILAYEIGISLTLLSPSYFEPGPRGGGGHIVPPSRIYFSPDCYEIWPRCKTSHNLKDSTINISQGHVGVHFLSNYNFLN